MKEIKIVLNDKEMTIAVSEETFQALLGMLMLIDHIEGVMK